MPTCNHDDEPVPDSDTEEEEEKEIVIRAKLRDPAAWAWLVSKYNGRLFGVAKGLLKDHGLAEDDCQETWLNAHINIHEFDEDRPFWPWLCTICVHTCIDMLRNILKVALLLDSQEPFRNDTSGPDDVLDDEARKAFLDCTARLPEQKKRVVELRILEGLTFKEIADREGITEVNARVLFFRAMKKVSACMVTKGYGPPQSQRLIDLTGTHVKGGQVLKPTELGDSKGHKR